MAIKILLNGCNGRMGLMFTRTAAKYPDMEIAAGLDAVAASAQAFSAPPPYPVFITGGSKGASPAGDDAELSGATAASGAGAVSGDSAVSGASAVSTLLNGIAFDVVVDFSHPSALSSVLGIALERSVPAVLATTGHTEAQMAEISGAARTIPVFKSPNMSIGINLMSELIRTAASVLAENFDIEIVEAHHNQKLDAPSGTALMLADAINGELSGGLEYVYDRHSVRAKRGKKELGIHAIRGGTMAGDHSVIFAGTDEVLEIKHSAISREIFAEGAVRAIRFIADAGRAPGLYNMLDVIRKPSA